jgi:hypothetical protein
VAKYNLDLNIFDNIQKNPTFLGVLVVTLIGQFLIIQYGGKIFYTQPLDGLNWGISIAIGSGSIVVGFLVRLMIMLIEVASPNFFVPAEKIDIQSSPSTQEEGMSEHGRRWNDAIHVTRTKIRVVNAFQTASGYSPVPRPNQPAPNAQANSWGAVGQFIAEGRFGRRDGDFSNNAIMSDPRRLQEARRRQAAMRKNQ